MSEPITVELRVLGHSFRLVTTEKEKADLERAALLLNDKYDEFRRKAPRVEPSKII
ncbi:MAG: cell division protein ZapA, partial [Acinetobacter johnsonii]